MNRKRNLKVLGIAIAAVFAFSAVASASAMAAPHFKASKTGELKGVQTGNQVFTTGSGAGAVTCTKAATTGTVTELEATAQKVTVEYTGCSAFGFASATVSPAHYNIHANGEIDVLEPIKITVPLGFCSVTVPKQEHLKSVSFVNKSGKIEEVSNVSGIKSTGTGGGCGTESSTGTYSGNNLVELVGGTVEWKEA